MSLVTFALAAAGLAQPAATSPAPPGVTVESFDWRTRYGSVGAGSSGVPKTRDYALNDPLYREQVIRGRQGRAPGGVASDPDRLSMPSSSPAPARRRPTRYESSLQLKNAGAKAIRAVEWEHVFYADMGRTNELRRFKLRRETKVGPGEQKFVSQSVPYEARANLTNKPRQAAVLTRVEYADGSVWQRR